MPPRPGEEPPKAEDSGRSPQGLGVGPRAGGGSGGWGPPDPLPAARALILTCHRPLGLGKGPPAAEPRSGTKWRKPEEEDKMQHGRRPLRLRAPLLRMPSAGTAGPPVAAGSAEFPVCAATAGAWVPRLKEAWEWSRAARSPVPGHGEENYSDVRGHKQTCGPGAAGRAIRLFLFWAKAP